MRRMLLKSIEANGECWGKFSAQWSFECEAQMQAALLKLILLGLLLAVILPLSYAE